LAGITGLKLDFALERVIGCFLRVCSIPLIKMNRNSYLGSGCSSTQFTFGNAAASFDPSSVAKIRAKMAEGQPVILATSVFNS
jgi:hypothetical protein